MSAKTRRNPNRTSNSKADRQLKRRARYEAEQLRAAIPSERARIREVVRYVRAHSSMLDEYERSQTFWEHWKVGVCYGVAALAIFGALLFFVLRA